MRVTYGFQIRHLVVDLYLPLPLWGGLAETCHAGCNSRSERLVNRPQIPTVVLTADGTDLLQKLLQLSGLYPNADWNHVGFVLMDFLPFTSLPLRSSTANYRGRYRGVGILARMLLSLIRLLWDRRGYISMPPRCLGNTSNQACTKLCRLYQTCGSQNIHSRWRLL